MQSLLLAMMISPAAANSCEPELPSWSLQGALVVGRVATAACGVRVDQRQLRVATDGSFVFGIGRDADGAVVVHSGLPGGTSVETRIEIRPRAWQIEKVDGVPESMVNPPPAIARRIAREQERVALARARDDPRQDFRFGFVSPLSGRISGVFGSQRILNGTPKSPHLGLDIAAPQGTAFVAPAAGIISFADQDLYLTGGTVLLDHGHGLSSVFLHLSRIDVTLGQRVEQGEQIGAVGATGRASGPHLHWGFNWFGERLDPGLLIGQPAP